MADVVDRAKAAANGSTTQSPAVPSISVPLDLLGTISASLSDLTKRISALEQRQDNTSVSATESFTRAGARDNGPPTNSTKEYEDKPKKKPESEGTEISEADFLTSHVEFRKEVYVDGKSDLQWVADAEKNEATAKAYKSFRYDAHDNGKLTFSVYRWAALYETLVEYCPPAHDGQVSIIEDRLQISGEFPLLHCRSKLEKLEKTTTDDKIKMELKVLKQLYERNGHLLYARQRWDKLRDTKKIDCESLRGLFHPGQLVVFRELRDEWAVARLKTITTNNYDDWYRGLDNNVEVELECVAIDFDGKNFRNHVYRRLIDRFSGTRNITELPVYPLTYHHDKDNLIALSIESGSRWKTLHSQLTSQDGQPVAKVMQYVGYCETFVDDPDDEEKGVGSEITGRVVVDPRRFPDRRLNFVQDNTTPFDNKHFDGEAEDDPLVLCPEKVLVHSLSDNEWYYVAMSKLQIPVWTPDAWSRLVKSESQSIGDSIERIRALAKAHADTRTKNLDDPSNTLDNFKGKGKGLTFLLHGPPGVGKTMLAECLSEEHKKPLYRVNLGMLVADMRWETTIEEIFRQAHVWDAILLIDEAEVVLAERTQESMHSLAWVAVFLRKIEYFEGILFLTTNQIHMIDPAFISRVNFGMKFPTLDSKTRLQIWEKMLGDLGDSNNADLLNLEKDTLKEWAMKPLNGRQIRNVIYSARLLADPPMTGQITKAGIKQCLADVTNFMDMIQEEKKAVEMDYMSHWA
ncbi:hypothetical protein TruAng_003165 [Truncatella angustata]|nr:hypothetical protein TruAng_003165 [Truncatella angustata]